jgi:hypothetical protein
MIEYDDDVQSLAFKLTALRSTFLCLSIEFSLATVILYAKNCTVHTEVYYSGQGRGQERNTYCRDPSSTASFGYALARTRERESRVLYALLPGPSPLIRSIQGGKAQSKPAAFAACSLTVAFSVAPP